MIPSAGVNSDGHKSQRCHSESRLRTRAQTAIARKTVPGQSFVIGPLRLVRCTEGAVHSLHGGELTHFTAAGKRVEQVEGPDGYERAVREVFGVQRLPVAEALTVVEGLERAP